MGELLELLDRVDSLCFDDACEEGQRGEGQETVVTECDGVRELDIEAVPENLDADERGIGGLGIFLTKKSMDDVSYEYKNGQNILTLKKNLR